MKPFVFSCVYSNVLTYFKDVFDGTSPLMGTFSFYYADISHRNLRNHRNNAYGILRSLGESFLCFPCFLCDHSILNSHVSY